MCIMLIKSSVIFLLIFAWVDGMATPYLVPDALKKETVCEEQSLNLECKIDERIFINNTFYGRNDKSTCPHQYVSNINCKSSNSDILIKQTCDNKQKCELKASNNIFGDPCVGTYKYLQVEYECKPASPCNKNEFRCKDGTCIPQNLVKDGLKDCRWGEDEFGAVYTSAYSCEYNTLELSCGKNEILSIINANYGRLSSTICYSDYMYNFNCRAHNTLAIVKNSCDNQPSCSITASNNIFGDPCLGTLKYAEVHYMCKIAPNCSESEFKCNHGACISSKKRCDGHWDCKDGEDEIGCSYLSEYACERSELQIHCGQNEKIQIIGGNYGRKLPHICKYATKTNCLTAGAKSILEKRCNNKNSCRIQASNTEFGDPCYGVEKYLEAHYLCEVKIEDNIISPDVQ